MSLDRDKFKAFIDKIATEVEKNPPRDQWKNRKGFNLVSLGAWLRVVQYADLPHVPATKIATIRIDDLFDGLDNPELNAFKGFMGRLHEAMDPDMMYRWDCCAPMSVKSNMSTGENTGWDLAYADPPHVGDDPRAADIIYEYPGEVMAIWQRPWITPAKYGGWPIEYRVFVENGEVIGVSNYYIQRPLPDNHTIRQHLLECQAMTERLAAYMLPPMRMPGGTSDDWPTDEISFTADYMVTEDGQVVWLEGGPPFGAGAHPCCYEGQEMPWHAFALYRDES